jgi:hypothetical protein
VHTHTHIYAYMRAHTHTHTHIQKVNRIMQNCRTCSTQAFGNQSCNSVFTKVRGTPARAPHNHTCNKLEFLRLPDAPYICTTFLTPHFCHTPACAPHFAAALAVHSLLPPRSHAVAVPLTGHPVHTQIHTQQQPDHVGFDSCNVYRSPCHLCTATRRSSVGH